MVALVLKTAIFLQSILAIVASVKRELILCQGEEEILSCEADDSAIHIEDAYYGRRNASNCVDESLELRQLDCTSPRSLPVVWHHCQRKRSCVLTAVNELFDQDPCPLVRKYLSVTYRCERGVVDVLGECPFEFWYPWIDADTPSGTGDYETYYRHRMLLPAWCNEPTAVQIQKEDGQPYVLSNDVLRTGVEYGVSCTNIHQEHSRCSNYKVRFCCPTDCAVEIRNQLHGEIKSPNYPLKYDENMDCSWIIRTTYDRFISFDIIFVELERQKECGYDSVQIVDLDERNIVFRECQIRRNVTVGVAGNSAQVRFISDANKEGRGFVLEWKALKIPACPKPTPPLYGFISTPDQLVWRVGAVVEYLCNPNFTMDGENIAHCKSNEEWSSPRPLCKAICAQTPLEYFRRLPDYCTEPDGTPKFVNVGKCPENKCKSSGQSEGDAGCCGARDTELRNVDCGTFTLPVTVTLACGCGECSVDGISISGIAFSGNSSDPLQSGTISSGGRKIAESDESGNFAFTLKRMHRSKVTFTFTDQTHRRFLNKVKVLEIGPERSVFLQVNMTRKPKPVTVNSEENSTVVLKSAAHSESDRQPYGEVHIVPNSVSDLDGNPYSGEVELFIHVVDNQDPASWNESPAPFEAEGSEDAPVLLENYGIFQFQVNSPDNDPLEIENMEIKFDASHVSDESHVQNMMIWSFDHSMGQWDEESPMQVLYEEDGDDRKVFLIGNINVTVDRIWSLNVLLDDYCYAKVRTYASSKFDYRDQLDGIDVRAVYMDNSGAWLGYSSEVTEGGSGACIMVPCEGSRNTLRVIHFSASSRRDDLLAASSNPFNSKTAGFSRFIADLLKYRRSDHTFLELPKTSFNLTFTNKYDVSERWYGPIYASSESERCFLAPPTDSHFRFYREAKSGRSALENEYSVVSSLGNISHPQYWGPRMDFNTACFMKVAVTGQRTVIRATSSGGLHPQVKGQLYGYRQKPTAGEEETSSVCLEFKCTKYFDDDGLERPLVSIKSLDEGCEITDVNPLLTHYLSSIHPSSGRIRNGNSFEMLAPTSPLGSDFGIYTLTRPSYDDAVADSLHQCLQGSSFRLPSGNFDSEIGVALYFHCIA